MVLIIPLIVYQRVYSHREKLGQPRAAKWFLTPALSSLIQQSITLGTALKDLLA